MGTDTKIYLYEMCINSEQPSKTQDRETTMADTHMLNTENIFTLT
jgi:hypothetical protein